MRRLVLVAVSVLAASVIGCGSWKRVGSEEQPKPTETLTQLLNTTQFYQRLGRLAAGDPMPFVGTVAALADGRVVLGGQNVSGVGARAPGVARFTAGGAPEVVAMRPSESRDPRLTTKIARPGTAATHHWSIR